MAKLSYNERFTNVKKYTEDGSYTGLQIASKLNQKNGQDYKLIDAIDIDWNGAWLAAANSYINNTEELLQAIDDIADLSDLEWIHNQIDKLNDETELIFATYVTQEQLDEILAHYQKPVGAGEHITIDSDNVISTYDLLTPAEADAKFTTIEDFERLTETIINDYYRKDQTELVAHQIALQEIQDNIIKNADEKYNDLEKISDWINSLPESIMHADDLSKRIDRLDEEVGFTYYNEDTDTYTYSGLLGDREDYYEFKDATAESLGELRHSVDSIKEKTNEAYSTAYTAYEIAYLAYESSLGSDLLAKQAYEMAYVATEKIGVPHTYSYFTELTKEQIDLLNEDPTAIQVYSIHSDNMSGIPLPDNYRQDSGLIYYTYTPEVEATGFYKDIDEVKETAYDAKFAADNALFRLYTRTDGTTYARLELTPDINDGTNSRTMILEIDEADIDNEDGFIEKHGVITTDSLYDSFSYAFEPEFITK